MYPLFQYFGLGHLCLNSLFHYFIFSFLGFFPKINQSVSLGQHLNLKLKINNSIFKFVVKKKFKCSFLSYHHCQLQLKVLPD